MAKTTTPLTAQERVILFCTATGSAMPLLASPRTQCSPWPSRDSSSTIARPGPMPSRTADGRYCTSSFTPASYVYPPLCAHQSVLAVALVLLFGATEGARIALEQIQMLSPINRVVTRGRCRRVGRRMRGRRPSRDQQDDHRQRKNHRDPKSEAISFLCHVCLLALESMSLWRTLKGQIGEMCELLHTRTPGISVTVFFRCCLRGEQHEQSVTAAAAHRTRYGAALSRVFVRDLGPHAPA
jgi:hypothetical protein